MITAEQLADYLDTNERKKRVEAIEDYIDMKIKYAALDGKHYVDICTGEVNNVVHTHAKTMFYDIWHNKDLTKESQKQIKDTIIKKYTDNGYNISIELYDCGWDGRYEGLRINDLDKTAKGLPFDE